MLRHYMSIRRPGKAPRRFNLTFDKDFILTQLVEYSSAKNHIGSSYYPNLSATEDWLEYRYMCFHDTQIFGELVNINEKEVSFMDMSEIVGEKPYKQWQTLHSFLMSLLPKQTIKNFFSQDHMILAVCCHLHSMSISKT